jgi:uncharacterized membrane protein YphA (DoxX/SURF4 family)
MKIFKMILLVILVLMSVAAGAAKVMQMPQEIGFFEDAGLSLSLMVPLGALQIVGGLMLAVPKTRKPGAIVVALCFLASALTIIKTGQIGFALVSLLPVAAAVFLYTVPRGVRIDS